MSWKHLLKSRRFGRLRCLAIGFSLVSAGALISVLDSYYRTPAAANLQQGDTGYPVHVVFCTDETDLRPIAVAINSTMQSSKFTSSLHFHVITTTELASTYSDLLARHTSSAALTVYTNAKLTAKLQSMAQLQDNKTEPPLLQRTPFMFAPFYIHDFLNSSAAGEGSKVERVIYLHTDVVLQGDIVDLADIDLQGHPVAVVTECPGNESFETARNSRWLQELGATLTRPPACGVQQGIFVADIPRWKQLRISERLEAWASQPRPLRGRGVDVSQIPWWFMTDQGYLRLDRSWNCNGLGRSSLSLARTGELQRMGYDHSLLQTFGATRLSTGRIKPSIITCSVGAQMIHFDGFFKPWLPSSLEDAKEEGAVCSIPNSMVKFDPPWRRIVRVSTTTFVTCADLWTMRITPMLACALRDFEKEWLEDDLYWSGKIPEKTNYVKEEEKGDEILEPKELFPVEASAASKQGKKQSKPPLRAPTPQVINVEVTRSPQGTTKAPEQKKREEPRDPPNPTDPPAEPQEQAKKDSKIASWADVRDRLNRMSAAHLKRSFAVLHLEVPSGGKEKLVEKIIEFLQKKEREKLARTRSKREANNEN